MDVAETELPTEPDEIETLDEADRVICPITGETPEETEMTEVAGIFFSSEVSLAAIQRWQAEAGEDLVEQVREAQTEAVEKQVNTISEVEWTEEEPEQSQIDKRVEHTERGIRVKHKMTRGTGPRDKDEVTAEVVLGDPGASEQALDALEQDIQEHMGEMRGYQPDSEDGDEDE